MEAMGVNPDFWNGRRVFLTGHTGFKGSWLAMWLSRLGAVVTGYALSPPTNPSLFEQCFVSQLLIADVRANVLDQERLRFEMEKSKPEIVFHLAAQSLVRESYREPVNTFSTNVMGTVMLLEAACRVSSVRTALIVTTDKCYHNREWNYPYREVDELGGADPYSASKACAELVASAWRSSFQRGVDNSGVRIATARAGNVIGGGDWAVDRLVPDCVRSFRDRIPVTLRYPDAVRPWQHVLEPLAGYLMLAQRLAGEADSSCAAAWNFGPDFSGDATVREVAQSIARLWKDGAEVRILADSPEFKESGLLRLDSTKARSALGWRPRYTIQEALAETVAWYSEVEGGEDPRRITLTQIEQYAERLR